LVEVVITAGVDKFLLFTSPVILSFNNKCSLVHLLDFSAFGNVGAESVSRAVVSTLWWEKEGGGDTGVEAAVSTFVIFSANSRGKESVWVGGVWAPSTLKSKDRSFGDTVRAVEDSSQVRAREFRRWDFNFASYTSEVQFRVWCTDTSVVDTDSISRAEGSVVVTRGFRNFAFEELIWADCVGLASTVGESLIDISGEIDNCGVRAPSTRNSKVVRNTFGTVSSVCWGELSTDWWWRGE